MYQAVYYQKNKNIVHVWDDQHGHLTYPYRKYAYRKNSYGKDVAIDGQRVEKVKSWTDEDVAKGVMYESDLRPDVRTLIDLYYESDDPSVGHRELFFDIEVGSDGGFATTENVFQPITSVAMFDKAGKREIVLLLDKKAQVQNVTKSEFILECYRTEEELLSAFLRYYAEIQPTILTGWNIDYFDVPYLYRRITKLLGKRSADTLSPIGEVNYDERAERFFIAGVSCLDYIGMYKLFTYSEEPSYSLEAISQKELGRGKIQYEGTLETLFHSDINKFIEYNVNDVRLVVDLDNKLKFLDLARGIAHKGHVPYEDVYMTTRYLDGACLTYLKRLGIVSPNRPKRATSDDVESEEFVGAFVKDPVPGLYTWIFDVDMASLYPSIIRTLNISPETKVGKISNWSDVKEYFLNNTPCDLDAYVTFVGAKDDRIRANDLREYLLSNDYAVSAIGVLYDKKADGLVPKILETWMQEREDNRALAKKYGNEGNSEKARFYDARQLTAKIVNNSLYGALGNAGFRFYDLDNAVSITTCGQLILKNYVQDAINNWFKTNLGTNTDQVIYVDTDSSFVSALPVIEKMEKQFGRPLSKDEKIDMTFKTAQIIESVINKGFDDFAKRAFNVDTHYLTIKQEYVGESGLWIAKKRYAQKIVNEKGVSISKLTNGAKEWKLDVKGMDVVRSSFPKAFRSFLSEILKDILNLCEKEIIDNKILEFKESMKKADILDIMTPTGVKELSKFVINDDTSGMFGYRAKGTPVHVKSALNYNDLLKYHKINNIPPIGNGEKIKWVYLKSNPLGIESLALKGYDDPEVIVDIIRNYIDYDGIFESTLQNKLEDFYGALRWGVIPNNNTLNEFFSF